VCDSSGKLIVDYVGKVESIEQDWAHVVTQLAIEAPLEIRNASGGRGTSQLSAAALDTVRQRYAKDFELFGYSAEPSRVAA